MTQLPAYAVAGGQLTAESLRQALDTLSGGAAGVSRPTDMKVTATGTSAVQVAAGSALVPTRYVSSFSSSSYSLAQTAAEPVEVAATGSGGGATKYVIARVDDPQFGGTQPPDPAVALYWRLQVVGTITNLPYPFVALAKIVMPPSTTNITSAMIEDLRRVALPRKVRYLKAHRVSSSEVDTLSVAADAGEAWPNISAYTVYCPSWATSADVVATYAQVYHPGGVFNGHIWVRLLVPNVGSITTPVNPILGESGGASRQTYVAAATVAVPSYMRGMDVNVQTFGRVAVGTAAAVQPSIRTSSGVVLDLEFQEVAE